MVLGDVLHNTIGDQVPHRETPADSLTARFATIAEAWFLDCALQYSGAPATTISGLWHLAGEAVWALADGIAGGGEPTRALVAEA